MRKFQLLLCGLCTIMAGHAHNDTSVVRFNTADKTSTVRSLKTESTPALRPVIKSNSDAETKHLTVEIGDSWFNGDLIIVGENYYDRQLLEGDDIKYETNLPAGLYDVILLQDRGMMAGGGKSVVVRENVDVAITDKLTLGIENVPLHRVRFRAVLPNGKYMTLQSQPYGGGVGKPSFKEMKAEGDGEVLYNILMTTLIQHSEYGLIADRQNDAYAITTGISFGGETPWDFNEEWKGDLYVNEVSDKYSFSQMRHVVHPSYGSIITEVRAIPTGIDSEWSNSVSDYTEINEAAFSTTPLSAKYERTDPCYSIETTIVAGGTIGNGTQAIIQDKGWEPKTWLCLPAGGECDEDFAIRFGFVDGQESQEIPGWGTFISSYMVYSPMVELQRGKKVYYCFRAGYGDLIHTTDKGKIKVLPDVDVFSIGANSPMHPFGKTPAYGWFLNYKTSDYDEEAGAMADMDFFNVGFFGIGQDLRNTDEYSMEFYCRHNGETVFHQTGDTNFGTMREIRRLGLTSGTLEYDFLNPNILLEEDMTGSTQVVVSRNLDQEDAYAPMLSMMTIRDTKNNQIDYILDEATDGELIFMGSDYDVVTEGEGVLMYDYLQPKDCIVKAEYAPHGSNEWVELELSESLPDVESVENCGKMYKASFATIDRPSENNWYDLALTLTDLSGNALKQILSPAMKINKVSGINLIANDIVDIDHCVVYDISGTKLGVGAEIFNQLGKGCYILKDVITGKSKKVVK